MSNYQNHLWSCHVTLTSNFEKFFISPNFVLNFRKVTKFGENWLKNKKSQAENKLGVETPLPSAYRVNVVPVYKSGERENLNNCRPTAVLPAIARVFEKLLYGQLYNYLMNNKLLDDRQFGFRSLDSTAL